jgi:tRNA(Ile)-lysidine synthase
MPPPPADGTLPARFFRGLDDLRLLGPHVHLLVGVSGGRDSVALLHLLRFGDAPARPRLTVAHLDHAMRAESSRDAEWVAGLCRAWGVPLLRERTGQLLKGEAAAREERYRFLERARAAAGATRIVTAHHADDQAETVLFRALRGTGLGGLGGIRATNAAGIARPLLPFWRAEIEGYARRVGLRWRTDPSNAQLDAARNRLRHELLPLIEDRIAPGAKRSLVRLAALAREAEAALAAVVAPLRRDLVRSEGESLLLRRTSMRDLHPAIATRLVRDLLHQMGGEPSEAGTRSAVQFITNAPSGRELRVAGGVKILIEFATARLIRVVEETATPVDRAVWIGETETLGEDELVLGGRRFRVRWREETFAAGSTRHPNEAFLARDAIRFPLQLRRWRFGDRVRLGSGTRRLKKLLAERRVPRSERMRIPVLVDGEGEVLWIAGLVQALGAAPRPGQTMLRIVLA